MKKRAILRDLPRDLIYSNDNSHMDVAQAQETMRALSYYGTSGGKGVWSQCKVFIDGKVVSE